MVKNTLRQKVRAMEIIESYIDSIEVANGKNLSTEDKAYLLQRARDRVEKTPFSELREKRNEYFQRLDSLIELAGLSTDPSILES